MRPENPDPEVAQMFPTWRFVFLLILMSFVVESCDSSFEPFVDTDIQFTILGWLDTDADTQFVRIVPLRGSVDRGDDPGIDAVVTVADLTAGSNSVWQDSLILFSDSTYGHVFWSTSPVLPSHIYRIEVERSDGNMAFAETTVPARPGDPDSVYGALNESADFAPLFWPGVTDVIDADVLYDIQPYTCFGKNEGWAKSSARFAHRIRYEGDARGRKTLDDEWRIELDLWGDRQILVDLAGGTPPFCAVLYRLEVRLATPSDEFDLTRAIFDREVAIQPAVASNVQGGFGFFGSVARNTVQWQLSPIALQVLRYDVGQ